MNRIYRQHEAATYTSLCEKVRTHPGMGDIGSLSESHLAQLFSGNELKAAKYLRGIALRSKVKKVHDVE